MLGAGVAATPKSYQASSRAAPFKAEEEAADANIAAASSDSALPPSPHRTSLSLGSGSRKSNKVVPQPLYLPRRAEEEATAEPHPSLRIALPASPPAIASPSSSQPELQRQRSAETLKVPGRPSLPRLIISPSSSSRSIQTLEEAALPEASELLMTAALVLPEEEEEQLTEDDWDCCGCFSMDTPPSTRPSSTLSVRQQQQPAAGSALSTARPATQRAEAVRVWDKRLSTGQTPPPVHLLKLPPPFPRASSLPLQPAESSMQRLQRSLRRSFNTDSLTAALKKRRWGGRGGAMAGGGGEASSSPTAQSRTADLLRAMPLELRSAMGMGLVDSPASRALAVTEKKRENPLPPASVSAAAETSTPGSDGGGREVQEAEQAGIAPSQSATAVAPPTTISEKMERR